MAEQERTGEVVTGAGCTRDQLREILLGGLLLLLLYSGEHFVEPVVAHQLRFGGVGVAARAHVLPVHALHNTALAEVVLYEAIQIYVQ